MTEFFQNLDLVIGDIGLQLFQSRCLRQRQHGDASAERPDRF